MNRRSFLKQGMLAGTAMIGAGAGMSGIGCSGRPRRRMMAETLTSFHSDAMSHGTKRLSPVERKILFYAALAPSGHNSQPWSVTLTGPGEWTVGSGRERWLPVVDPDNREVLLSIGAFIENLVRAARVFGYEPELDVLAKGQFESEIARIRLGHQVAHKESGVEKSGELLRMAARRTVKTGLRPDQLALRDLKVLEDAVHGSLYYFPRSSSHARAMAEAAIENFRIQFDNPEAMVEAARWTRLSDDEAERYRDGLTPDSMEIHGLAGFWARHFLSKKDVTGELWRKKAVEKAEAQAREGGGWMAITSPSHGVADLIEAGRRFQRLALAAVPLGLGIHPMTQTLEEHHGQTAIQANHAPSMIPQFMLRVGYVVPYPEPVSLRRPVDWFVTG